MYWISISLQRALKEAQDDLDATQCILDKAKEQLAAVENGIASLEAKYQECLAKKEELDNKFQLCGARLIRADKVRRMEILKLGSQQIRQCGENAALPIHFH